MPEITITTTVTFDPQRWAEDAMYMPGVWLVKAVTEDEGVRYHWIDDETGDPRAEFVPYQRIAAAIVHLSHGSFTTYDGTEVDLPDYQVAAAAGIVHSYEDADYDAETDDLIAQMAVFGKVIYG